MPDHFPSRSQKTRIASGKGAGRRAGQGRVIAGDLVLVRIPPGQYARQAGRTEAAGHIPAPKCHALSRQPVEPRRANLTMTHEPIITKAHVGGDDQDDVWRPISGASGAPLPRPSGCGSKEDNQARKVTADRKPLQSKYHSQASLTLTRTLLDLLPERLPLRMVRVSLENFFERGPGRVAARPHRTGLWPA